MFFVEIIPDFDSIKKSAQKAGKWLSDMFNDANKEADKLGKKVEDIGKRANRRVSSAASGSWEGQTRQGSDFRNLLNEAIRAKMLSKEDFTSMGKKRLQRDFKSGDLARALADWKNQANQATASTSKFSNAIKNSVSWLKKHTWSLQEMKEKARQAFRVISDNSPSIRTTFRNLIGFIGISTLGLVGLKVAAIGALSSLKEIGRETERQAFSLSVAFGNKANAINAMKMAERMGTNGAPFKSSDMVGSFKNLMEIGIDPTKAENFKLFGNIAGATGQSMTAVSEDITGAVYGNSEILRKYGVSNKQIFALDRMVNQRPDARRNMIMGMLSGDSRYKDGMRDFATSWDGMVNVMSNHWTNFKKMIIGDPSDRNSLYSKIKETFGLVIKWFERNSERIKRVAIVISEVLKWVVRQVTSFMRWVARGVEGLLKKTDGSVETFKTKTLKLVLWLELTKQKIVRFFEKWGWLIKWIVAVWVGSKIVRFFLSGIGSIVTAFGSIVKVLLGGGQFGLGVLGSIRSFVVRGVPLLMRFLGPIGLITAGLLAIAKFSGGNKNGGVDIGGVMKEQATGWKAFNSILETAEASRKNLAKNPGNKFWTDDLNNLNARGFTQLAAWYNKSKNVGAELSKIKNFNATDNNGRAPVGFTPDGKPLSANRNFGTPVTSMSVQTEGGKKVLVHYDALTGKSSRFDSVDDPALLKLLEKEGFKRGEYGTQTINIENMTIEGVRDLEDLQRQLSDMQKQGGY